MMAVKKRRSRTRYHGPDLLQNPLHSLRFPPGEALKRVASSDEVFMRNFLGTINLFWSSNIIDTVSAEIFYPINRPRLYGKVTDL